MARKRITLKSKKKQIEKKNFEKQFNKAVKNGAYIYLMDKDIQKKAIKLLGYDKSTLNIIVDMARDTDYKRNADRFAKNEQKRKEKEEKRKEREKTKERKKIVENLNKLDLTHESKQKIISDAHLGLLKFVGKEDAEENIRKELVNKVTDLFFGDGSGKGILKGAFQRNLPKDKIDNFVNEVNKFIMSSNDAVSKVSDFYENIDKYFEFIYEENMVEKGYYTHGVHDVEMGYILEDLLATFKTGLKQ